jgi:hypothetical protein
MAWWKSFRRKLRTARGNSFRDWVVIFISWWVLLYFYFLLRTTSLERLNRITGKTRKSAQVMPDGLAWVWHHEKLIQMAARLHLLPMTCLPRALTLRWMASRRGIPSGLRIGIGVSSPQMTAHAWVEVQGQAIGEAEDINQRFTVFSPINPK